MPDHVKQQLIVLGEPALVRKVVKFIRGKLGTPNRLLDFNRIVPMPAVVKRSLELLNIDIIIAGYEEKEQESYRRRVAKLNAACLAETGCPNWYAWLRQHWGSGSNAHGITPERNAPHRLFFRTDSTPAFAVFRALSAMFPDVVIHLEYLDEIRQYAGRTTYAAGGAHDERVEWNSLEADALRYLLGEDEGHGDLITELEGIH